MNLREPVVSVVIPTLNRAHLIANAIDCVLDQTYRNAHVVLIDDGSTDATEALVADRYGGNPRVIYRRQANAGVSAARNAALAIAQGDYIAFLDSDDGWQPWKLELQVACMQRLAADGVEMIWTDMDAVDAHGGLLQAQAMRSTFGVYRRFDVPSMFEHAAPLRELVPDIVDPTGDTRVYWGDVFSSIVMGNLCQPSTVMLTRARAARIGGFDTSMIVGEDHDYHLRACRDGPSAFVDIAATRYRKGAADQLTQRHYQLQIARNLLRTIEPAMRNDRLRIRLPARMLREKLASAHAWVGAEMLFHEDLAGARRKFARSLRHNPLQPHVWASLAAACLPKPVFVGLRKTMRKVRNRTRKLHEHPPAGTGPA